MKVDSGAGHRAGSADPEQSVTYQLVCHQCYTTPWRSVVALVVPWFLQSDRWFGRTVASASFTPADDAGPLYRAKADAIGEEMMKAASDRHRHTWRGLYREHRPETVICP
jgi:hypothetical protein